MIGTTGRLAAAAGTLLALAGGSMAAFQDKGPAYPESRKVDIVDDYHGTKIADPYRWLEDDNSDETAAWVKAQNEVTNAYLAEIPARASIKERLTKLWDFEKFTPPQEKGGRYLYSFNTGLQNQNVLLVADTPDAEPRVLLDPNTLSADGTIALSGLSVSKDGKKLAYALAEAGSDWTSWRVRDIDTGEDLDDLVRWSKFSGAEWTPDGKGFFYGRFPEPKPGDDLKAANYFAKLYYHEIGKPQADDLLVWKDDENKDWRADPTVTDDGEYLILTVGKGTDDKFRVLYRPLAAADAEPKHLVGEFDHDYTFIDNAGPLFFFRTDFGAPRKRVVAIDINNPGSRSWQEIIPEAAETLQEVSRVGDTLIALYLKDAHSQVKVFGLDGKLQREIELPGLGTVAGFDGDRKSKDTFYSFTSYSRPTTIYRFDLATGKSNLYRAPKVPFDPSSFETKQVFYASKDGTKVPMFITHKKGLKPTKDTPCLLYGYGGFNIPITPAFSPVNLVWMELGGVYAVANLRGGGEYGEEWHQGGTKLKKQNVFEDFISAAEYLIAEGYTSTPKLGIEGRSNGGLLVGACLTQRPDLYGATLPGVGVLDMLRFHKFTIGWAWTDDFGSSDNPDEFPAIRAYSPLHNLKPGTCYPPTLITTGDHDDRVFPAHSFKFAAAIQAAQACSNPVLIRIDTRAGHGAGKPTAKLIEESADKLSFLVQELSDLEATFSFD